MVKMAQHLGGRHVLGLAALVVIESLVGINHQPGRWLDSTAAHVDTVMSGCQTCLLVGVADGGEVASTDLKIGVEANKV